MSVGALAPTPGYDNQTLIVRRETLAGSLIGSIAETQEILDVCAEHDVARLRKNRWTPPRTEDQGPAEPELPHDSTAAGLPEIRGP